MEKLSLKKDSSELSDNVPRSEPRLVQGNMETDLDLDFLKTEYEQSKGQHDKINEVEDSVAGNLDLEFLKAEYEQNRDQILKTLRDAVEHRQPEMAEDCIKKYLPVVSRKNDNAFRNLYNKISDIKTECYKNIEHLNILNDLILSNPDAELGLKLKWYSLRVELDPHNDEYRRELNECLEEKQNELNKKKNSGILGKLKDVFPGFKTSDDKFQYKEKLKSEPTEKNKLELKKMNDEIYKADVALHKLMGVDKENYRARIELLDMILDVYNEGCYIIDYNNCQIKLKEIEKINKEEQKRREDESRRLEAQIFLKKIEEERIRKEEQERLEDERKRLFIENLSTEYHEDRDGILIAIKSALGENKFQEAKEFLDKYKSVAIDDVAFDELNRSYKRRYDEYKKLNKLQSRFDALPEDDYVQRYEICEKILELLPNDQKYTDELIKCEIGLGLRPKLAQDLRLGRVLDAKLTGFVLGDESLPVQTSKSPVTLALHTHGISVGVLKFEGLVYNVNYRIHYSQIVRICTLREFKNRKNTDGFANSAIGILAGVAIGAFTAGVLGAVVGGIIGGIGREQPKDYSEDRCLVVCFWDNVTDSLKKICFKTDNANAVRGFIGAYNNEIELTKRSNRQPESEIGIGVTIFKWLAKGSVNIVKWGLLLLGGFTVIGIIIGVLISTNKTSDVSNVEQTPVITEVTSNGGDTPALPISDIETGAQNTWVSSGDRCVIRNVGTKMTVSGHTPDDAVIEVDGVYAEGCKTVAAGFDTSKPMDVKCTAVAADKIKLSVDRSFVRRMRKSKEMKLTLPTAADETRTITYTLMGFSDACPWTK